MSKELGEKVSKSLTYKIAHNLYISKHAQERLKERYPSLYSDNIVDKIGNIHHTIMKESLYGYNGNDGSIHYVLSGGYEIIVIYNDTRKKWVFATIKEPSENGYFPSEKRKLAQRRVIIHKEKNRTRMNENENSQRHDNKTRKAKPYKREKFNWREY